MVSTRNESRRIETIPLTAARIRHNNEDSLIVAPRADSDLVLAAQSGDDEAFAELCRRHSHAARQRILGILRHREDAEDAARDHAPRLHKPRAIPTVLQILYLDYRHWDQCSIDCDSEEEDSARSRYRAIWS